MDVRKGLAGTAAALLCASVTATAAVNDWTAIGPEGGSVLKFAFSQTPKTVFADAAGGFYRSRDGGVTWQLIFSGFPSGPSDLALDPADPARVYVTSHNAPTFFVSTDGGATLAPAANFPSIQSGGPIAVSRDGKTLYVASTNGLVYCSVDRAQTWVRRTSITNYTAALTTNLVIDPSDPNTLYIASTTSATTDEIFASHDGGVAWTSVRSVYPASSYVFELAISPSNPRQLWAAENDGLWMSNDQGATWTNVLTTPVDAVAVDPVNPAVAYAGTGYGQVFRTADSGGQWTDVTGNLNAGQINTLAVNPAQNAQILVGGFNGIGGSMTSGTQWTVQQAGMVSTAISGISADPGSDRIYFSVPTAGVYYESGGSGTALPVNNGGLLTLAYPNTTFDISAMLAQPGGLWVSQAPWIENSTDGGNTWSAQRFEPSGPDQFFAMASPAGVPQTVMGAAISGLYRTTNGGAAWAPVSAGIPAASVISRLLTAPSDPAVAYASLYLPPSGVVGPPAQLGVYKSIDAGASWAPAGADPGSSPNILLAVDPAASNVVYGALDAALLKSIDGGAHWTALPWSPGGGDGGVLSLAIDPVHPKILYASGTARIARSVDGGSSWETLRATGSLPVWAAPAMLVDPKRPETLLVGTDMAGVQVFTAAPDLGLTVTAPVNPVAEGVAASYRYTLSNLGPFDATGVHVSLQLPAAAQGVSVSAGTGTCSVAGATASCTIGVLRSGAQVLLLLNATPAATGSFTVTAAAAGDQPDPHTLNNSVTSASDAVVLADLSVTVAGTAAAQAGAAISYTLTVTNAGPNVPAVTQVTYQLATGLTAGTVSSAGAACVTGSSGLITCTLNNLAVAKPATITVNATAAITGTQTSTAAVSSAVSTDPVAANNSAASITVVSAVPVTPPATGGKSGGGSLSWPVVLALMMLLIARSRIICSSMMQKSRRGRPGLAPARA